MNGFDDLQWDSRGLIPAIVQDAASGEVLSLAYINKESLARTRELGETVFFSRSRQVLWHKGESSGNSQKVISLTADCDKDSVLIRVDPAGPACHTGARSCFFEEVDGFAAPKTASIGAVLIDLEKLIAERKIQRPEGSYTSKLFDRGLNKILQKVGEEATETVIAAMSGDRQETIKETSDLLFHLLVGLREMGISLDQVAAELERRRK